MASRLEAVADLYLEMDGIDARLSGSGSRLTLQVDRPGDVYRQVRRTFAVRRTRTSLAAVARYLDEAGLTVDVMSTGTRLFSIGSGPTSRLGALVVGSEHVAPGAARPVARALLTALASRLRTLRPRRH